MQEWLQGSSRQNEMKISEVELMCGIEAVAYYMTNAMERVHEGAWKKREDSFHGDAMATARVELFQDGGGAEGRIYAEILG